MNDSLHSLFLAQVIGLYLFISAIIMGSRIKYYRAILTDIDPGHTTLLAGAIGLILGIILVVLHNIWIWESEVLITLVSWGLLIKSILWLSFPEYMADMYRRIYSGPGYYVVAIVAGVIGILLMAHGFYLFSFHY